MKSRVLIGIDEAGRGPLAGPVAVGVVALSRGVTLPLRGLKDSKKLSEAEREMWFARMKKWKKEGKLFFSVSLVSHAIIDSRGISYAIRLGIMRALRRLVVDSKRTHIYLDGGLKAPAQFSQKTIIKGDEKVRIIALASISAKVTRDRAMKRISRIYPSYHFDVNKGYGTLKHRQALLIHGACPVHRISFLRNFDKKVTEGLF